MAAPAIIRLIKLGIFSLFRKTGAKRMINSISENCNTGFFNGNAISIRLISIVYNPEVTLQPYRKALIFSSGKISYLEANMHIFSVEHKPP